MNHVRRLSRYLLYRDYHCQNCGRRLHRSDPKKSQYDDIQRHPFSFSQLSALLVSLVLFVCVRKMSLFELALFALFGQSAAQLTGRRFPNCDTGPLKNNTVCHKSAGIAQLHVYTENLNTDNSIDPLDRGTAWIKLFTLEEKLNTPVMSVLECLVSASRLIPGGKKHFMVWYYLRLSTSRTQDPFHMPRLFHNQS